MKIKIDKKTQTEFSCLMLSDLEQILLVRKVLKDVNTYVYECCVLYDKTDTTINNYLGTIWTTESISKYTFLPKGYKITIKN